MTDTSKKWLHSDKWKLHGKGFLVEIVRWSLNAPEGYPNENTWNIYLYLYPGHERFKEASECDFNSADEIVRMHGGVTFFKRHVDEKGALTSICIGNDYNHYGDEFYTRCVDKQSAWRIFEDAGYIYDKFAGNKND